MKRKFSKRSAVWTMCSATSRRCWTWALSGKPSLRAGLLDQAGRLNMTILWSAARVASLTGCGRWPLRTLRLWAVRSAVQSMVCIQVGGN